MRNPNNPGTYIVYVQMPVVLHNEDIEIVETTIDCVDEFHPVPGTWINHVNLAGLMLIGHVIYDADRNSMVLSTAGSAYDYTVTLDEWLKDRPQWHKAEKPFILLEKQQGKKRQRNDDETDH